LRSPRSGRLEGRTVPIQHEPRTTESSPKQGNMVAAAGLRYRAPLRVGRGAMDEGRTLAVDIGGTGIKLALLDSGGRIIGKRVRVPTPAPPVGPEAVTAAINTASAELGAFDRVAVGFPGVVRGGRI